MNKLCTSLEQSQRLTELGIDVNTADMDYIPFANDPEDYDCVINEWNNEHEEDWIPAWSISALLGVLPYPSLHKTFAGWRCDSYDKEGKICKLGENTNNPVDACYEAIVFFHEQKLL